MRNRDSHHHTRRRERVRVLRIKKRTKLAIFALSLLINVYAIDRLFLSNSNVVMVKDNRSVQLATVEKVYNLANYRSVSKFDATIKDRYNRLLKRYNEDIQVPKEKRYNGNDILPDWDKYCRDRVRRIVNLQARVYDLEVVLENIFSGVDNTSVVESIKNKGYEEKLAEMSNYYAGFLNEEAYNFIIQTAD